MIQVNHITGEITFEYDVKASSTHYYLNTNASISVSSGHGIYEEASYSYNDYLIKGSVQGGNGWLDAAIDINGVGSHIIVAKSGMLEGYTGASLNASYETIDNRGHIDATGYGIFLNAYSTAENSGTISADYAVMGNDHQISISNDDTGVIKATTGAITFGGTDVHNVLYNSGMIKGDAYAVHGLDGVETITNRGTIKGEIALGGGDDVFDNRHGTVDHAIKGGIGDDILIVDDAKTRLAEAVGEGTDLIKSSVSYKLSANIENLTLFGKHDVNGVGNAEANTILGTSGENTLSGKAGADILSGFRGDDILSGGTGSDIFLFSKGTGHDVVTDFKHGEDHIDLSGLDGIVDFDEMMAHHVTVSGSDLVIHSGEDRIRLEHVSKSDLDFHDFYY